ncbi:MAG: TM2 domain-containing protein [Betaproteobacteria bacterium]|nr:TM2 domain-containing protein [Betaproteobacteria bacterium]
MTGAWKKIDLAGGGLQSANVRLAALLRKRRIAYALLALFPLGLHRAYLHDRRGAWMYRAGTLLGIGALLYGETLLAGFVLAAASAFAIYDLLRLEDGIARVNKQLRMDVYLHQTAGAPPGFRGHYTDGEPSGARDSRPPSFSEQEKRLRELAATRGKRDT